MTQNSINSTQPILQKVTSVISTVVTCNTTIPNDNTIPQNTEGTQVLTTSITPSSTTTTLQIDFVGQVTKDANAGVIIVALFQDSTANALCAIDYNAVASIGTGSSLRYKMASGTTSSTTFKIRIGSAANVCYVNSNNAGSQVMGGVSSTRLTITEYL